jgi:hypothetical protein
MDRCPGPTGCAQPPRSRRRSHGSNSGNPPSILNESQGYLEYYGQLRKAAASDQDLFDAMVSRYPDWVSRQQFLLVG